MRNEDDVELGIAGNEVTDISDINPSALNLQIREKPDLLKIKNVNYQLVNKDSNTVVDENIVLAEERMTDKSEHYKTYKDGSVFRKMATRSAATLLEYILDNKLQYGTDVFDLVMTDFLDYSEVSKVTGYNALNELLDNRVIFKRVKYPNSYYINVQMFYKGNRRFLIMKYRNVISKLKING